MATMMKIGEVARGAGVTVDTVRFYERRGVLPPPERRPSGYRVYTEATVQRIRFARGLQSMGFMLDEVIAVLASVDGGQATCVSEQPKFEAVIARIDAKIEALAAMRRQVLGVLEACRDGRCSLREQLPG